MCFFRFNFYISNQKIGGELWKTEVAVCAVKPVTK